MQAQQLTPVELELMEILWKQGESTVHEVLKALPHDRQLAYTSVSTILRILQQKKVVTIVKNGRQHRYVPLYSQADFTAQSVKKVVKQAFSGSSAQLVAYLVQGNALSAAELEAVAALLKAKKQELK